METFPALLSICVGNSPVTGEFPSQRPVTRSFDVFFHLRLNKRLSKQWWGWWFETASRPLWRHCNGMIQRSVVMSTDKSGIPSLRAHVALVTTTGIIKWAAYHTAHATTTITWTRDVSRLHVQLVAGSTIDSRSAVANFYTFMSVLVWCLLFICGVYFCTPIYLSIYGFIVCTTKFCWLYNSTPQWSAGLINR